MQMQSGYFLSVFWPGVLLHPRYSPESLAEAGLVSMESGTCICDTGLSHMCVIKFLTEGMSLKLVRPCLAFTLTLLDTGCVTLNKEPIRTWALPSGTVKEWRL